MPDPLVVQTLSEKRAEILGRIAAYEAQIAQAKHDLAHVSATIRLFTEPQNQQARYLVSHGFFKKGEIAEFCALHLGASGEMTTRELAERVMIERGLDPTDTALRNSVVFKAVRADGREAQGHVRLGARGRDHAARRCQYPFHVRLTGAASAFPIRRSVSAPLL